MKTKALFKQVVKLEQIDPLWSISGEKNGSFQKQYVSRVFSELTDAVPLRGEFVWGCADFAPGEPAVGISRFAYQTS